MLVLGQRGKFRVNCFRDVKTWNYGLLCLFQKFGTSHSCLSSHYISEINLSNDTISITIVNANHQNGHRMYEITDCASYKFVQVTGHKQVKVCVSQPQKMWI